MGVCILRALGSTMMRRSILKVIGKSMKKISFILIISTACLIGQCAYGQQLGLLEIGKDNGVKSLSLLSSDTDSCGNAFGAVFLWEQNLENFTQAYDTMQWYIRHCYANANASQTWSAYNGSWNTEVQTQAGSDSIFNFVLYGLSLRSDNDWFCYGVPLLEVKYNTNNGQTPGYRADRAIYKFLMDNPRCAFNIRPDSISYVNLLTSQWNEWADTSQPGSVFDSSLPSMQSLGLDTLLSFAAVANYTVLGPQIILIASITENPFLNSTSIALSIGREAYLNIGVYNILGQQIAGAGYAGTFEQGSSTIPINMANVPSGAYYVRISTANNEVQTLKLTKE